MEPNLWVYRTDHHEMVVTPEGVFVQLPDGSRRHGPMALADGIASLGRKFVPVPQIEDLVRNDAIPTVTAPCRKAGRAVDSSPASRMTRTILTLFREPTRPNPNSLGIDLVAKGGEIRKLLFGCFASHLRRGGFDPEEAYQEVMMALAIRNRGSCPFDARKSSFGHYVHIVISGVLANMARKAKRRSREVQDGLVGRDDTHQSLSDIQMADLWAQNGHQDADLLIRELSKDPLDQRILRALSRGDRLTEICAALQISRTDLQSRLDRYRKALRH